MFIPNWLIAAAVTALCGVAYLIADAIEFWREQHFLHAVYDGDRVERWKEDRRQARLASRRIRGLTAHRGGLFIGGTKPKRNRFWISGYGLLNRNPSPHRNRKEL